MSATLLKILLNSGTEFQNKMDIILVIVWCSEHFFAVMCDITSGVSCAYYINNVHNVLNSPDDFVQRPL